MTTTHITQSWAKKALALLVAMATALGLAVVASPAASADTRGQLRAGCSWSGVKHFVQNCKVWSPSMGQNITVQIKPASRGGSAGVYMLDGLRARDDWNAWTYWGKAPHKFVNDNVTLVMPVGGQAQFYADWIGPFNGTNGPKKPRWETFLTRELPGYLQRNFGVSPTNNSIVGLSMGGTGALNLAAHHRNQFKQVTSLSGYTNPTWPGMYLGLQIAMLDSAGPGAQMWNMWGNPLDPRRFHNDPTIQAVSGKYAGMPMFLSAAGGIAGPNHDFLADPLGVFTGVSLEWLSRTSTAKFELAARASGANVVASYPINGIHAWDLWDSELSKARPHILRALGA